MRAFSKKHEVVKFELLSLAAIAIIFSNIVATSLFLSATQTSVSLDNATSILWFSSLLSGIASSTVSLSGMEWHRQTVWAPRPSDPGYTFTSSCAIAASKSKKIEGVIISRRHSSTSIGNKPKAGCTRGSRGCQ